MKAERSERVRDLRFLAFYVVLNVAVGTYIAIMMESHGYAWTGAIPIGAACSVVAFHIFADIFNTIHCAIWRRTRGYPFAKGDLVEVTSGPYCGAHGRVVWIGQAPWIFEIAIENTHGLSEFSAGCLRKVVKE